MAYMSEWAGTQAAYAVFHLGQLQNGSFRNFFFCYRDNLKSPSKVCKACFGPYLHVFHLIWVLGAGGGGGQMGLVHNLLMYFFTPYSLKIEVSETNFFDTVITQNDHPRYIKHVLARI